MLNLFLSLALVSFFDKLECMENLCIETLFKLHSDHLFAYAYRKIRDKSLAEDLVQEAFLGAVRSKKLFQGQCDPKYWLLSILKNKIADYCKQNQYRKKALSILDTATIDSYFSRMFWAIGKGPKQWSLDSEEIVRNKKFLMIVDKCISDLPEKLRNIFT